MLHLSMEATQIALLLFGLVRTPKNSEAKKKKTCKYMFVTLGKKNGFKKNKHANGLVCDLEKTHCTES